MIEAEKLTEYTREINEMRRRAGENWRSSTVEGSTEVREWNNESKKIIIKNMSSIDVGQIVPWEEILVFAPDGEKSYYKMTRETFFLIWYREGYDRFAYEAKNMKIIVTVWRNRMAIKTWGSRKKRKMLKVYRVKRYCAKTPQYQ